MQHIYILIHLYIFPMYIFQYSQLKCDEATFGQQYSCCFVFRRTLWQTSVLFCVTLPYVFFFQMAGVNCPPAAIAQSREDLEFKAIAQWEEMASFQFHCKQMVDSIPKPPTLRGTLVALAAVADFLALTAESSTTDRATKGVAIAARAANRCLTELLDTAGLSGAPLAAKYCCQPGGNMEALTHLQQIQPTSAPGEDNMGDEDQPATGGLEMLLHLASVQHYAAKIINRSVRETPFAACSL